MHCHFMPYHCIVTTCLGISYHFIMIHNTSLYDNITSLHFMSHLGISYQIMAFHAISWHFIPHLGISYSYHIKAFHTTSWHFTPYGISYNIIFHTTTYGMSYHITYNTYVSYIFFNIMSNAFRSGALNRHQPMLWIKFTGVWWHLEIVN